MGEEFDGGYGVVPVVGRVRMKEGRFRCVGCGVGWRGGVGPQDCPVCGGLYLVWVDYGSETNSKKLRETGRGRVP